MKIHAIVGKGESNILTQNTSCYCSSCLLGTMCDSWTPAKTCDGKVFVQAPENDSEQVVDNYFIQMAKEESEQTAENKPEQTAENKSAQTADNLYEHSAANEPVPTSESEEISESTKYVINEFVAAVYQHKWYIGKVI
ncbi:hypothetical protein DPMN_085644 [Dreissena polymorpha]|uniref:Uncharacterized protein n=1 Tax=Dreissena polymorpha TaxID=45954 RepID=A0A9D4BJL5_DREPO|nr:hypothetical protein DPMN_085644 [Dreissena polymorpha]